MRHARFSIKHLGIRKKRIFIIVVLKTPLKGVNLASVLRMIINAHQVYVSSGNVCKENLLTTQTFYSVSCIQAADKFLLKLVGRSFTSLEVKLNLQYILDAKYLLYLCVV